MTRGSWRIEQEATPGQLSMQMPAGDAASRGAQLAFTFPLLGVAAWLLGVARTLWNEGDIHRGLLAFSLLLFPGIALFSTVEFLQRCFNVLHLQVREDVLVLRTGPIPRWRRYSLQLEWIDAVEVDWTDDEHEVPGLEFTLKNGTKEHFPFKSCSRGELQYAAAQVRATLPLPPAASSSGAG